MTPPRSQRALFGRHRADLTLVALLVAMPASSPAQSLERWLPEARAGAAEAAPKLPDTLELARPAAESAWVERWGNSPPSIAWTETALELIVKYRQNPLRSARVLAYVNVAAHDALAACEAQPCSEAAQRVSMHVAAGRVLEHLYPEETPGRLRAMSFGAYAAVAATHAGAADLARAWRAGAAAGETTIQRALYDGSDAEWDITARPAPGPGVWRATPPLFAHNPLEATAPRWRTWVLGSGADFSIPDPPAFGTDRYRAETDEVLRTARALTPEQKRIAEDWNLDLGTVTPGGVWNRRAIEIARAKGLSIRDTARLLTTMNIAVHDAFIACWYAKLKWWTARPITVIRDSLEPAFTPHVITPGFPSYPSGHATISAAAAEVLAAFLPENRTEFEAAAAEAAMSRLYGGIHFRSDNDEGLALGRQIGRKVAARVQPARAPRVNEEARAPARER